LNGRLNARLDRGWKERVGRLLLQKRLPREAHARRHPAAQGRAPCLQALPKGN